MSTRGIAGALLAALPLLAPVPGRCELTLQPSRTLDTTLDEGTWMQPDIAPDGRTLVFDLLGDVYELDAAGGVATPLLTGMAFERHPVFSPDGQRIAFISDRSGVTNLWVVNADGSNARPLSNEQDLTVFTSPAWSADGRFVYVSRMKHAVLAFELWKFDAQGSGGTAVVKSQPNGEGWDERINALGAVLSPDGRHAYYSRKIGHTWTDQQPPNWSISRLDLRSNEDTVIISGAGGAMRPALSHDGKLLVYASRSGARTGLRLRHLETGEDRWLTMPVDHDAQEQGYYGDLMPRYVFAPDDRSLIASVGGKLVRIDVASGARRQIPFSARVKVGLGPPTRVSQVEETGPVRVRVNLTPRQSPDGTHVAFTALGSLYLQELESGAGPRIVPGSQRQAFQPSWSHDGKRLVYVTWDALEGGAIWAIPVTGGKPSRLTTATAFYTEPRFSPDGKTIVAIRASHYDRLHAMTEISPDRASDLIRLPSDGGEAKLIVHAYGARLLDFAAGNDRIRFYGPQGVSSVRLDGTDLRRELVVKAKSPSQYVGAPVPVEEVRLNPAGDKAVARTASQLFLVHVGASSDGKPPEVDLASSAGVTKLTDVGADFFDWADQGQTIQWSVGAEFRRIALESVGQGAVESRAQKFPAVVEVARDVPDDVIVLRGAKTITMRGTEVIDAADIVIVDNRISAVGPTGTVPIPPDATIRDASGKFIVPGFVDAHAHWFEIRRQVHDERMWNLLINLAYGVTSGLDVQPFTTDAFAYQDMIDAGVMPGPRAWSVGPGVFNNSMMVSREAAVQVLRRYRDFYRTRNIKSYMVGDRERRQFMVEAAQEVGMMPTTEGASDVALGLTHAIDGFAGNEHSLPVTPLRADVIQLYTKSGTSLVPTLGVLYGGEPGLPGFIIDRQPHNEPKVQRFMPPGVIEDKVRNRKWLRPELATYASFAADAIAIQRSGGLIGVGSHGEVQGLGFHWELEMLAAGGATPIEVLHAATIGSAEVIGHERDVGSIEPGKFADLLVLDADPLENIRNTQSLRWVMKNGRLYDAATLDEVWPRQRPLGPLWFREERSPSARAVVPVGQ